MFWPKQFLLPTARGYFNPELNHFAIKSTVINKLNIMSEKSKAGSGVLAAQISVFS
jgi:hypothetical protein